MPPENLSPPVHAADLEVAFDELISETDLRAIIDQFAFVCFSISKSKGWWSEKRSDGDFVALFHSEISEMFEAVRAHNPRSTKIPDYSGIEEELADLFIRIFDYLGGNAYFGEGFDVPGAIVAKMHYNMNRPFRHGGKAL